MVITALVVGVLVAYYFGLDAGAIAAAVTAGLIIASKVPGFWFIAYGILTVGIIGVCVIGPRMKKEKGAFSGLGWVIKKLRKLGK
jgi:hypothetical protein